MMTSGLFWQHNISGSGQIDALLDKENVTLAEVLEKEDIIQECKSQNKKLIEFLTRNDILSQLLDLILKEPNEDDDVKTRFKFPNIASELMTCDVQQINEKLACDTSLMDKMYNFLESPAPLNPLLASFFSKAFGVLITRKSDQNWYNYSFICLQVINYIKSREGFTRLLLRHVHTSAIMDLLLRLITCIEGVENKQNILDLLNDEKLIERVIDLFSEKPAVIPAQTVQESGESVETPPGSTEEVEKTLEELLNDGDTHDNAGHLLVEIIRGSRDSQMTCAPNERCHNSLLQTVESKETVELLLNAMLSGCPRQSVVVNVVSVLLVLLEVRRPLPQNQGYYSDQDNVPNKADIERQEAVVVQTCETIIPRLPELVGLLTSPPIQPFHARYHSAEGAPEPFGATRLAVCKLLSTLLSTQHAGLNQALVNTPFLANLLDLSFNKFKQNNFLHHETLVCVKHILFWEKSDTSSLDMTAEGSNKPPLSAGEDSLQTPKVEGDNPMDVEMTSPDDLDTTQNPLLLQLFVDARLFDYLTSAWDTESTGSVAYMGHVIQISNHLQTAKVPLTAANRVLINQLFHKLPQEVQTKWEEIVSGKLATINKTNEAWPTRENKRNPSSDDDSDFRDIQFPQDTALQQMFSDYQMQNMSDNFEDTYGFNEFSDADDQISRGMGKLTPSVNFLMNTDDATQKAIFESICETRPKGYTDSDSDDEDIWADRTTELTFGTGRPSADITKARSPGVGADSSDEDEDDKNKMDVDHDPWASLESSGGGGSAPWGDDKSGAAEQGEGWAKFDQPAAQDSAAGGGWADFGGGSKPSSGGGETGGGGEGFNAFGVFSDPNKQDDWEPAMSSSPEATMLDKVNPSSGCTSSPVVVTPSQNQIFHPETLDFANTDANQGTVPSDLVADNREDSRESADSAVSSSTEKSAENAETKKSTEADKDNSEGLIGGAADTNNSSITAVAAEAGASNSGTTTAVAAEAGASNGGTAVVAAEADASNGSTAAVAAEAGASNGGTAVVAAEADTSNSSGTTAGAAEAEGSNSRSTAVADSSSADNDEPVD